MSLGSIVVRLSMNTADFDTDSKRAASIAKKRAKEIDKAFTAAGAAIGLALAGAAAAIIKNTIDASREQAQLEAVLKSTGAVAGQTREQLNLMADGLQQVSTFAAGNITEMQSLLLTFTKIQGDVFPKAQQAILNMSTALGTDLKSAALQVGKALNDPLLGVSALGRAGVQFSEDQKELIKSLVETGETAKAQEIILAELETQFGGSALAASNTLGGALTVLKNNFNDLLEGDAGGAGVKGTIESIQDLSELLRSDGVREGFASIIDGATNAAIALAKLLSGAANVTKFLAEEASFQIGGKASADDAVRLEAQRDQLRARLERNGDSILTTPLGFSDEKRAELEAELQGVESLIKAYYDNAALSAKRAEDAAKAANEALTGAPGTPTATGTPSSRVSGTPPVLRSVGSGADDAVRKAIAAQEELDAALRATESAAADFNAQLVAYRNEVSGPLAQSQAAWAEREAQLRDLAARGEISQDQLNEALEYTTELRLRDADAIKAQLSPAEEVLASLEEELRLLGLTNEQRELANALKYAGVEATSEKGKAIAEALGRVNDAKEQIQAADELRRGFEDTFASIIDGSKSAKDAFEDLGNFITQLVAQRLAAQLTESLFGGAGGPLGGSIGGGGFGAFLGSLFGGGRAGGGIVSPGKIYEVTENGPEMLRVGSRQFLLPTAEGGMVTPGTGSGGGGTVNQSITVVGRVDSRTASQLAAESGRAQRRVAARFGA